MKTTDIIAAAAIAISGGAEAATTHVMLDYSGSNPLVSDERFAEAAGNTPKRLSANYPLVTRYALQGWGILPQALHL